MIRKQHRRLDTSTPHWKAARVASRQLQRAGIPHQLIGGLALSVYGYVRATDDVDFLVGEAAMIAHRSGLVTLHPEVPIAVGDIAVDMIPAQSEGLLEDPAGRKVVGIPVASAGLLVLLKLQAGRRKDIHDVQELIEAGLDVDGVQEYLADADQEALARFVKLMEGFR